jgi:hypothetical protein
MTTYTLNIQQQDPHTNSTKNINVTTDDAQDLLRLLMLSGVDAVATPVTSTCGAPEESAFQQPAMQTVMPMMEQQAAYDYGHRDATEEQDEFTITDYNFRGRADIPERLTSARFGSNPLRNDMTEGYYQQLKNKYQQFLEESNVNAQGVLSPLTDETRDKFEHDPQAGDDVVTDGSHSPLSTIVREKMPQ